MLDDPSAGLGFLESVDGLFIQQKVELFEALTGCETMNRYHITPIPAGAIPDPVPKEWIEHFKEEAAETPMLKAKEESECLERIMCPMYRSFNMVWGKPAPAPQNKPLNTPPRRLVHTFIVALDPGNRCVFTRPGPKSPVSLAYYSTP